MIKKLFLILSIFLVTSCKSSKTVQTKKNQSTTRRTSPNNKDYSETLEYNAKADKIVDDAKQYKGTRYKYGGTTKKGMDCSGLVTTAFKSENILLPRTTGELAKTGDWIDLKDIQKGDLVFFATRKNSRTVNHVGIVTNARIGNVEFIHASTSAGVIISSLSEKYWYFAYVQARRVL